jgi:hypothetical protein
MSTNEESEKKTNNTQENNDIVLELQLGDVIQITNQLNENLNDKIFIIDYIDSSKAYLINTDSLDRIKVKISEDGTFGDGNITKIAILSRSDAASYAKQNDLLPGKWINIYFEGDFPVIITGEITNLEEDMIEVKTIDGDVLYINFDYKGIPEDLPINTIEIREKPQEQKKPEMELEEGEINEEEEDDVDINVPNLEREHEVMDTTKLQINIPTTNIKNQLREFILRADQIKFGDEELGPVVQFVDVSSKSQRYSIETQVSDLLDELLSTIPNTQRTPRVLNNIHIMIERFKQLREKFSFVDEFGNVEGAVVIEADYKPLTSYFKKLQYNLYWLLPVVKNIKKVYNANNVDDENTDIVNISLDSDLSNIKDILDRYKSNTMPVDQNKYAALYSDLNPYFTPFDLIGDEDVGAILTEKIVKNDINVIIDNLGDFYSSVFNNNNIRLRRFVIEKYNLGLTKLDTIESTNTNLKTVRVQISRPDTMSIKSFLFLPEPTIRFSKINLPGTDILTQANLNLVFLNYWEFLKKKTNVNDIFIDTFENSIDFNENNFANNIKQYILNLSDEELGTLTKNEIYSKFIKLIVPKTKVLFNLMKKYITGKLSIVDVVSYLEPFLVYSDHLTYMQYVDIIKFIDSRISQYNINFVERSRIFSILTRIKSQDLIATKAYSIITILNDKIKGEIFQDYDIQIDKNTSIFTNSELIRKITLKDYGRLYTTGLSLQNVPLMFPSEISSIFESEKKTLETKEKLEEENDACKQIIVAKQYNSLEDLNRDNDAEIYFDKRYDKTNYALLENEYERQVLTMSSEDLKVHIIKDLMEKKKITESEANYLAETLVDGHKRVLDGQYALLYNTKVDKSKLDVDYYVRREGKWIIDNEVADTLNTDDSNILCNLQEKCVSVPNNFDEKCESITLNEVQMQNKLLKNVMNEFDTRYKISKEEFEEEINTKFEYYSSIIGVISNIETNNLLKYNNQRYKIGVGIEDETSVAATSPSLKLLNLILKQSDFVKKQNDIVRFVKLYTRQHISTIWNNEVEGIGEDIHWLYCPKSNAKLLPVFKFELASEYIRNPRGYKDYLDLLKSKIGKLSDDGDMWCDKYTGWSICPVDFDVEEGYEEGFRVSTRAELEEDAGNKITFSTQENTFKYDTPDSKMINNIVNALSVAMGINIENQKEFIINCVLSSLKDTLETESDYKEKVKEMAHKGKKIASYKDFYNTAILYYTIGMYLIAVQTSIPSVKTRKTHPGCVRSFSGYPFEGAGDLSSLNYLVCVAYDIRESGEPWNVLKGKKVEIITGRLKASIDDVLLSIPDVKIKFEEKTDYLLTNKATEIPQEHDITKWTQFLPPLVPFHIKHLTNISQEFKSSLISDLRNGSPNQREKLLVIDSKIIQFSLAIQERIQAIIKRQKLILQNSNNEPYIENACCEGSEGETTIGYFEKHDPSITEFNQIVQRLTNIMSDVLSYSKSGLFYSDINTKNKYPPVSNAFDERIIYLSFIHFCKFKTLIPIPEDLLPLCTDKPDAILINPNDSVDRIIQKLKDDGRNYTNEQLLRLLQLVGRNNIVNINLDSPEVSYITKLTGLLESIREENDEVVEGSLINLISDVLDTFDIASTETTKQIRDLNNYLIKANASMKEEIIEFIEKNSGSTTTKSSIKKVKNALNNLSNWISESSKRNENIKISDERLYNIVNFYKTFIDNFVNVFPNIILNKVNHSETLIPSYLGFSDNHAKKLKKYISEYYEKLKTFYGASIISNILTTIQKSAQNIFKLSKTTPSFTSIKIDDKELKPIFDERTSKYLFEFYLLKVLLNYIELSENDEMLVVEARRETEITDIFTAEYLEERETQVDLTISSRDITERRVVEGNMKELRQKTTQLLIAFIEIMNNQKDTINTSYEEIQDRVFKLREREKDLVTDRLKQMTDEERDGDTILKINKLGMYSKGMQKGLTTLDKNFYDEEQQFRDQMETAERTIRKKNKDANDENIDLLVDELIYQQEVDREINEDAYDMSYMNEDFHNGNTDGFEAPEEEYEDYADFD